MNLTDMLIIFSSGIVVTFLVQMFLLKQSVQFATWIVETVTQLLIRKVSLQKQNSITNYLGLFLLTTGSKFIRQIEDAVIKEEINVLDKIVDKISEKLLQSQSVQQEDVDYIKSVVNTDDK